MDNLPPRPNTTREGIRRQVEAFLVEIAPEIPESRRRHVEDLIRSGIRLLDDGSDDGQLRMVSRAVREMRHSWVLFNQYRGTRKVTIYGSARTPEEHPDYIAAKEFSALMAHHDWMTITGAGDGIMKAGHEGPSRESIFGLRIRLPFETSANEVIEGDPKLVSFRYFFTRKLMFMSHANAVAVFPGGFGTQDELFECLTLIQTGKSNVIPVVLLEGPGREYWDDWLVWITEHLCENGWISREDLSLLYVAKSPEDAAEHVRLFYRRYHSARYVGGTYVMRLVTPLSEKQVAMLADEFCDLVDGGTMRQCEALAGETDHLDLPRLAFTHTRRGWGRVRELIDRINLLPLDGSC
ncbi:MAG: LOG family protein [Phycisphaerales bacterium]|jgi:hypothetical protein|nr:LOG family protein [Phycisphaerales bacterium]